MNRTHNQNHQPFGSQPMSRTHKGALLGALLLAAALRLWGFSTGPLVWHPDEFHFAYWPLLFFSGDLNPHFFSYPSLHFYLLALVYGGLFLWQWLVGAGWSLVHWASFHFFADPDPLLASARLVSIAFAVGTVGWAGVLAARVYGPRAGPVAALLLAACTLHVRQSGLAAVDVPMTFWFVGCIWAAVRLLDRDEIVDYALGGALVGLAASTKYPGALAGGAIAAAHLFAGRSLWQRRLWLAGAVALGVFVLGSPYVLLDFASFKVNFAYESEHLQRGRGDLGLGWWYHIKVSLRYGLGWAGLFLGGWALVSAVRGGRRAEWVVGAGFLAYYLTMGSGRLVFVRYALPLMVLQTVLVSGVVVSLHRWRWRWLLLALALAEPLYGSIRVAQLQASEDTRMQARTWIERHAPPGTSCCNFGGWAGDVPLRTFADQWWRIKYYERKFGRETLDRSLDFLAAQGLSVPYYRYAVMANGVYQSTGDLRAIEEERCTYVIVHRHPLFPEGVDDRFAAALAQVGKRVIRFTPQGLTRSEARYDPIDAYYLPIGIFGPLQQTGPEIEIWRINENPPPVRRSQTVMETFARGYALAAALALFEEVPQKALDIAGHALQLAPGIIEALDVQARALTRLGRIDEAIDIYLQIIERTPDQPSAYHNLARLYVSLGQHQQAVDYFRQALARDPDEPDLHNNLGVSLRALGNHQQAIRHWLRTGELEPDNADALFNLGTLYYTTGQYQPAVATFERLLTREPDHLRGRSNLAAAYKSLGEHERAIHHWLQLLTDGHETVETTRRADALYNICATRHYALNDPAEAASCWAQMIALVPEESAAYVHLANAYSRLGRDELARNWFHKVLERFPDHPQASEIRQALATAP